MALISAISYLPVGFITTLNMLPEDDASCNPKHLEGKHVGEG